MSQAEIAKRVVDNRASISSYERVIDSRDVHSPESAPLEWLIMVRIDVVTAQRRRPGLVEVGIPPVCTRYPQARRPGFFTQ